MSGNDIVISSRVRLARNLYKTPYPSNLHVKEGLRVMDITIGALSELQRFNFYRIKNISDAKINFLQENYIISKTLINSDDYSAVALSYDETISVMINEEDHIRLSCIEEGFNLNLCYRKLNKLDNYMLSKIDIDYDENLGFLTSCPSNLGTGLRASVLLFLPATSINGKIDELKKRLSKNMYVVRGMYGEGSQNLGFLYQISNQYTLGATEDEIINGVVDCVNDIIKEEIKHRKALIYEKKQTLLDKSLRAYGILTNCYSVSFSEFMEMISYLKLGYQMELFNLSVGESLNDIISICKPSNISRYYNLKFKDGEENIYRAQYINKILKGTKS